MGMEIGKVNQLPMFWDVKQEVIISAIWTKGKLKIKSKFSLKFLRNFWSQHS